MRITLGIVLSLLPVAACEESGAGRPSADARLPTEAATSATTPASPLAAAPPPPAAAPLAKSVEEAPFRIDFVAPTSVKVGEAFALSVKLSALNGYKVNQEYPIKFALEGASVTFEPSTLRKEQLTLTLKEAELKGRATAATAGELSITGKLSFSVCTDERCLIEKRDVMVKVKAE